MLTIKNLSLQKNKAILNDLSFDIPKGRITLLSLQAAGKGLVISTQDTSFASKILDRIVLMEKGNIIETYDQAMSSHFPETIRNFLQIKNLF